MNYQGQAHCSKLHPIVNTDNFCMHDRRKHAFVIIVLLKVAQNEQGCSEPEAERAFAVLTQIQYLIKAFCSTEPTSNSKSKHNN